MGTLGRAEGVTALAGARRATLELSVFALAALALVAADAPVLAAIFAALVVVNALLLTAFDQWER